MIDKLEAGKSYRLIDKDSFLSTFHGAENTELLNAYFREDIVTINHVSDYGEGFTDTTETTCLITKDEMKYFKLAEKEETPTKKYWDGKAPLEVGMFLSANNSFDCPMVLKQIYKRKTVSETQYLVEEENTEVLHLFFKDDLKSILPDPKEEFCKEILSSIRGTHPDFAQDTTWDIKEVAAVCWDKLKGGESE